MTGLKNSFTTDTTSNAIFQAEECSPFRSAISVTSLPCKIASKGSTVPGMLQVFTRSWEQTRNKCFVCGELKLASPPPPVACVMSFRRNKSFVHGSIRPLPGKLWRGWIALVVTVIDVAMFNKPNIQTFHLLPPPPINHN